MFKLCHLEIALTFICRHLTLYVSTYNRATFVQTFEIFWTEVKTTIASVTPIQQTLLNKVSSNIPKSKSNSVIPIILFHYLYELYFKNP